MYILLTCEARKYAKLSKKINNLKQACKATNPTTQLMVLHEQLSNILEDEQNFLILKTNPVLQNEIQTRNLQPLSIKIAIVM